MRISNIGRKLRSVSGILSSHDVDSDSTKEVARGGKETSRVARYRSGRHVGDLVTSRCSCESTEELKLTPNQVKSKPVPVATEKYEVQPTDTFIGIAAKFDMTPSQLLRLNHLSCRNVFPGQVIDIPVTSTEPEVEQLDDDNNRPAQDKVGSSSVKEVEEEEEAELGSPQKCETCGGLIGQPASDSNEAEENNPSTAQYLKLPCSMQLDLHVSVPGTLLITTDTLMFAPTNESTEGSTQDPNLLLGLDRIRSVAVYRDPSVMYLTKRQNSHHANSTMHSITEDDQPVPNTTFGLEDDCGKEGNVQVQEEDEKEGDGDVLHSKDDSIVENNQETTMSKSLDQPDERVYLCILAKQPHKPMRRHPTWFTRQSTEVWFTIESLKTTDALFDFLIDLTFYTTTPPQSDSQPVNDKPSGDPDTNNDQSLFLLVDPDFDWLLPGVGIDDQVARKLRWLASQQLETCRFGYELPSQELVACELNCRATRSVESNPSSYRSGNQFKQQSITALTSPSMNEERDALRSLKLNSIDWELISAMEMSKRDGEQQAVRNRKESLQVCSPWLLPLPEACGQSQVLDASKVRDLMCNLPPEAEGLQWLLTYSTAEHGFSLRTMYAKCSQQLTGELDCNNSTNIGLLDATAGLNLQSNSSGSPNVRPCILVIKTNNYECFGAVLSSHPVNSGAHFYGLGSSTYAFQWISTTMANENPQVNSLTSFFQPRRRRRKPLSVDCDPKTTDITFSSIDQDQYVDNESDSEQDDKDDVEYYLFKLTGFKKYIWTGSDPFFIRGDLESLTIGCSDGNSAIYLDDSLRYGRTEASSTFENPPLCSEPTFVVANLEIWSFS